MISRPYGSIYPTTKQPRYSASSTASSNPIATRSARASAPCRRSAPSSAPNRPGSRYPGPSTTSRHAPAAAGGGEVGQYRREGFSSGGPLKPTPRSAVGGYRDCCRSGCGLSGAGACDRAALRPAGDAGVAGMASTSSGEMPRKAAICTASKSFIWRSPFIMRDTVDGARRSGARDRPGSS